MTPTFHPAPLHCRNCQLPLGTASAHYCPNCGQETAPHPPSAGEFIHEFVGHYIALEGPLLRTLGLLFFRPGELTREYLQGRKRRYVLPLRLYLSISLVFFLVMGVIGAVDGTNMKFVRPDGTALIDKETQKDLDQARADMQKARDAVRNAVKGKVSEEKAEALNDALDKTGDVLSDREEKAGDIGKSAATPAKAGTQRKMWGADARSELQKSPILWEKCAPAWLCARLKHRIEVWNGLPPDAFADAMKTRALHTAP
ncbi:MAG: DUF3667 domain-containing protein, partial [Betaproteobacteria bacterium]